MATTSTIQRTLSLVLAAAMIVPLFLKTEAIGQQELFPGPFLDKIAHASYFGIMGAVLDHGFAVRSAVPALLCVAAVGAADELNQRRVPGRSADVFDWLADAIGAAIALGWRRRARRTA